MPQRYQRPYPSEFRREAVSLVKVSGRSVREVAGELGVSSESLRIWVRQEQLDRPYRACPTCPSDAASVDEGRRTSDAGRLAPPPIFAGRRRANVAERLPVRRGQR